MPAPVLPVGVHSRAFAHAVALLRGSPTLAREVALWRLPADADFDNPLPADKLGVRLTPRPGTPEPFAALGRGRRSVRWPLTVVVTARVPGNDWALRSDLLDAVRRAFAPRPGANPTTFLQSLRAHGIADVEFGAATAPATPDAEAELPIALTCYANQ